jgi:site-specific DNA-methyltransferase (cytosine-N4-specific)
MKPYIQPFEKRLAFEELSVLSRTKVRTINLDKGKGHCLEIESKLSATKLAERLAYWECVNGRKRVLTNQVLREATVNVVRNGIQPEQIASLVPFADDAPLPNKRCLRYGPHGIHEYRGKFFPQLVKALINMADLPRNGVVADPMCGSGTTLVESVLAGYKTLGLDYNPLSVLMARTKCALLSVAPEDLIIAYRILRDKLVSRGMHNHKQDLRYFYSLPEADQSYLRKWFAEQVLLDLDEIAQLLNSLEAGPISDLMNLALSNILRTVSWQKKDDLRVRKEIRLDVDIDPIKEFLEEMGRTVRMVLAVLYQNRTSLGSFNVQEEDARMASKIWKAKSVDIIVTSPPYATALPYLDTDRLSLIYLRLLSRTEHRQKDFGMIGNREITGKWRKTYWEHFQSEKKVLPKNVSTLINRIAKLNAGTDAGFRRHNLPSLLAKYFFDMRDVFTGIDRVLKSSATAYVVVGNNHTIANGERVDIPTADLLSEIAETVGLKPMEHIPMEMLLSRDIFKKNAVTSETILTLKRSGYK